MTEHGYYRHQSERFDQESTEYSRQYADPTSVLALEKVNRLESALSLQNMSDDDDVVEIGVGTGEYARVAIERANSYIGLDLSPEMLAECRDSIGQDTVCRATGTAIPLSDASADIVNVLGVLGYLYPSDMPSLVAECARILRPGGQLVISFANADSPARRFRQWYFYSLLRAGKKLTGLGTIETASYVAYAPKDVTSALREANLRIQDRRYLTFLPGIGPGGGVQTRLSSWLDDRLHDVEWTRDLAMTWILRATKPTDALE